MRSPGKLIERRVRNAAPPVSTQSRYRMGVSGGGATARMSGIGGQNDPAHQIDMFHQVSPLNAGVSLHAQATSMIHWHLYRTHDQRGRISGPDSRKEVFTHQALNVWEQPNEIMTGQFFREMFQLQLELTGHTFWLVDSLGSIPTAMWPLSKSSVDVIPAADPDAEYAVAGYVYYGPDRQTIPLTRDEVIWVRTPDVVNFFGASTAVQSMTTELESQHLTAEYKRNFFKNNAEPGGVWELGLDPGVILSDEDFNTLAERWAEQHRGVKAAHRVAILEQGKWVSNRNSLQDMQFTELRRDDRDAVYEGLGVSKSLLGVTEDVNRANAETNEYVYAKYRTVPRLERIKGALNGPYLQLFGGTGQGVQFDYDSPVPADWRSESVALREKGQAVYYLTRGGATLESAAAATGLTMLEAADAVVAASLGDSGVAEEM